MHDMPLFQVGLVVLITAVCVCGYLFMDASKTSQTFIIEPARTVMIQTSLESDDVGFFKVYMPDFAGQAVFVQILDPGSNIIADKKIQTKMAVNYFDIKENGKYATKVTNISQDSIPVEIEFGETHSEQIMYPAAAVLAGTAMMLVAAYKRLSYSTAHPDENIS